MDAAELRALRPTTGGDGSAACSGGMLLQALLGCAGVTLRSVATAMDARGTLGVSREAPVGMHEIEVLADLDTDADDATLEEPATLTERYCVVAQTLGSTPRFTVEFAAEIAQHAHLMGKGRIVRDLPADDVLADRDLQHEYLGV